MKIIQIISQVALLYAFSFFGNILHDFLHIPIPGSILGFFLLLSCLFTKFFSLTYIQNGARTLLDFLPIIFLPSIIGVMNYSSLLSGKGILLIFSVVISTLITIVISGLTSQGLENKKEKKRKEKKKCHIHSSQSP
jgi:holin-like protein